MYKIMYGPFSAKIKNGEKTIKYLGNKVSKKIDDVSRIIFSEKILNNRMQNLVTDERYYHLHEIDNAVFIATVKYFQSINAQWCNLPLTTLMISSPGEVYAGETINYTTDTLPVDISWFNNKRKVFLSESSQFYLELRLLIDKADKVFSIYNSFRKERADFSHLSEFQHIEFEGKLGFQENIKIASGILKYITQYILKKNLDNLRYFLVDKEIDMLSDIFDENNFEIIPFKKALNLLYKKTNNQKYQEFSLKNFGSWEEIKLTEILKKHAIATEFPLLQTPFYNNTLRKNENGISLAENADFILYGFRETIGSGVRINDPDILAKKSKIFNLPPNDYNPYLKSRNFKNYKKTAGFGLGWQRYIQWLLKLPFIWEACHIPRGHLLPKP